ncbi:hypothetical protein NPIL_157361, partial [Nephila pilipes]
MLLFRLQFQIFIPQSHFLPPIKLQLSIHLTNAKLLIKFLEPLAEHHLQHKSSNFYSQLKFKLSKDTSLKAASHRRCPLKSIVHPHP